MRVILLCAGNKHLRLRRIGPLHLREFFVQFRNWKPARKVILEDPSTLAILLVQFAMLRLKETLAQRVLNSRDQVVSIVLGEDLQVALVGIDRLGRWLGIS